MKQPRRHLRVPLPDPRDVELVDAIGRAARGRAAVIRRLYREERVNLAELAAYFGITRCQVSYALRHKASATTRKPRLLAKAARQTRDPIARAMLDWLVAA